MELRGVRRDRDRSVADRVPGRAHRYPAAVRGELALLRAVGFGKPALLGLVLAEHLPPLAYGLAAGVLSSLVAVHPTQGLQSVALPVASLAVKGFSHRLYLSRFTGRGTR